MKRILAILVIVVALGACGARPAAVATPMPTPLATETPEPADTPTPWPVAWGENVCIVIDSYERAVKPLKEMGIAAGQLDFQTVSDKAYVVGADMLNAEVALMTVPKWAPGAAFVAGLLKATLTNEAAMDLLDDPPAKITTSKLTKATKLMDTGRSQFDAAIKLLEPIQVTYGFTC